MTAFFLDNILGEIFLTGQEFLEKQNTGCLEEVRFPQGEYTLLNELQHLTHTQSLGLLQSQSIKNTEHTHKHTSLLLIRDISPYMYTLKI